MSVSAPCSAAPRRSRRCTPNGAGSSPSAIVYLVAGIIALGNVFSRDRGERPGRRRHDVHRRRGRGHQRLPGQDLGTVHFLAAARRPLHRRGLSRLRQPVAHRGLADAVPRRGAGRLGDRAHLPRLQHEAGSPWVWVVVSGVITLVLGLIILAHWPFSARLHARHLPRRRPRLRRRELDRARHGPAQRRGMMRGG